MLVSLILLVSFMLPVPLLLVSVAVPEPVPKLSALPLLIDDAVSVLLVLPLPWQAIRLALNNAASVKMRMKFFIIDDLM